MPEQWPRALLRAALREAGYDAVGTRTLSTAMRVRPTEPDRGPVRLVVVDQGALSESSAKDLEELLARLGAPETILLARATVNAPEGRWRRVLRRPFSVEEIVNAVQALLPLPQEARYPID
jgi:DNA-binding response OmpR family regulator